MQTHLSKKAGEKNVTITNINEAKAAKNTSYSSHTDLGKDNQQHDNSHLSMNETPVYKQPNAALGNAQNKS